MFPSSFRVRGTNRHSHFFVGLLTVLHKLVDWVNIAGTRIAGYILSNSLLCWRGSTNYMRWPLESRMSKRDCVLFSLHGQLIPKDTFRPKVVGQTWSYLRCYGRCFRACKGDKRPQLEVTTLWSRARISYQRRLAMNLTISDRCAIHGSTCS